MNAVFESSPRAWGCFPGAKLSMPTPAVFPTCVGVFPLESSSTARSAGLPHVRGGVSNELYARVKYFTVFPTCVGVFPSIHPQTRNPAWSSPRAWGCFSSLATGETPPGVFPTCVGVFLTFLSTASWIASLPHVRGGVSLHPLKKSTPPMSSPRAWGCF